MLCFSLLRLFVVLALRFPLFCVLCCVVLCYVVLCCVVLCYVVLYGRTRTFVNQTQLSNYPKKQQNTQHNTTQTQHKKFHYIDRVSSAVGWCRE